MFRIKFISKKSLIEKNLCRTVCKQLCVLQLFADMLAVHLPYIQWNIICWFSLGCRTTGLFYFSLIMMEDDWIKLLCVTFKTSLLKEATTQTFIMVWRWHYNGNICGALINTVQEEELNSNVLTLIAFTLFEQHRKQLQSAVLCSNTCADSLAWQLNISYMIHYFT